MGARWCVPCLPFGLPTGAGVPASGPEECRLWSFCGVFPAFCPLLLCFPAIPAKYAPISHFKGVSSVVWAFRVGLFVLGALRGLCGFCVRERLGGFGACGVFALVFPLFALVLSFYPAFVLCFVLCPCVCFPSRSCCLLLSLCLCCFFFPYGLYAKKGAKCFPLRPLLSCCVLC